MVRHHVAQCAGFLIEAATGFHADGFGDGDLHVVDAVAVPHRLEHPVGEAQRHDVLHRLLAEEMIDAVDLMLLAHSAGWWRSTPWPRLRRGRTASRSRCGANAAAACRPHPSALRTARPFPDASPPGRRSGRRWRGRTGSCRLYRTSGRDAASASRTGRRRSGRPGCRQIWPVRRFQVSSSTRSIRLSLAALPTKLCIIACRLSRHWSASDRPDRPRSVRNVRAAARWWRGCTSAGTNSRFVRSPPAPKMTMAQGPGGWAARRGGACSTWPLGVWRSLVSCLTDGGPPGSNVGYTCGVATAACTRPAGAFRGKRSALPAFRRVSLGPALMRQHRDLPLVQQQLVGAEEAALGRRDRRRAAQEDRVDHRVQFRLHRVGRRPLR